MLPGYYSVSPARQCKAWLHNCSGLYAASEVKAIVEDEAATVSKESDNYWVLTAALKRYLDNEGNGQLPIEVCTSVVL